MISEYDLTDAGISLNMKEDNPAANDFLVDGNGGYKINCTLNELEILKKIPNVDAASIQKEIDHSGRSIFPYDTNYYKFTIDSFGTVWVPKKKGEPFGTRLSCSRNL